MESKFSENLLSFVNSIQSLKITLPLLLNTIDNDREMKQRKQLKWMKNNSIHEENDEHNQLVFHLSLDHYHTVQQFKHEMFCINKARDLLPNAYLLILVSQYDAFIGTLLRIIFCLKPAILNSSEKNLTFSQLTKFNNIEEAKIFIVEKEIDSYLRNSHVEQIKWLEDNIGVSLTKDLRIWQNFVEITERRNLLVHTDGKVSNQYLQKCKSQNVPIKPELIIGDCLNVDLEYFQNACDCFFEFCVKLTSVLWRHLVPDDLEKSDETLNQICFDLLLSEENNLAIKLLEFGTTTCRKHSSEKYFLFMQFNKAQAHKWIGEEDICQQIIDSIDLSTKKNFYLLIKHVLKDEFKKAADLMPKVHAENTLSKGDYKTWPVFKEFRKTIEFQNRYKEIFNEEIQISENSLTCKNNLDISNICNT